MNFQLKNSNSDSEKIKIILEYHKNLKEYILSLMEMDVQED